MKNNILAFVAILMSIIAISFGIWAKTSTPKVAYVRTALILEKYKGVLEVKNKFQQKEAEWKSNVDTLTYKFNMAISSYNEEMGKLGLYCEREGFRKIV